MTHYIPETDKTSQMYNENPKWDITKQNKGKQTKFIIKLNKIVQGIVRQKNQIYHKK